MRRIMIVNSVMHHRDSPWNSTSTLTGPRWLYRPQSVWFLSRTTSWCPKRQGGLRSSKYRRRQSPWMELKPEIPFQWIKLYWSKRKLQSNNSWVGKMNLSTSQASKLAKAEEKLPQNNKLKRRTSTQSMAMGVMCRRRYCLIRGWIVRLYTSRRYSRATEHIVEHYITRLWLRRRKNGAGR